MLRIIFLLFLMFASGYPQQQIKNIPLKTISINDTLSENIERINSFKLNFHTFRQKYFNEELSFYTPINPYSALMLNNTSFSSVNPYAPLLQQKDMIRSYKMLYGQDEDLKYLQMILGMAQTTAVGIMAYQHIKKYGFLSK